jgi:hypothetical protein
VDQTAAPDRHPCTRADGDALADQADEGALYPDAGHLALADAHTQAYT